LKTTACMGKSKEKKKCPWAGLGFEQGKKMGRRNSDRAAGKFEKGLVGWADLRKKKKSAQGKFRV
jgi:hypothetical protein